MAGLVMQKDKCVTRICAELVFDFVADTSEGDEGFCESSKRLWRNKNEKNN
jgi:hypothetical protein